MLRSPIRFLIEVDLLKFIGTHRRFLMWVYGIGFELMIAFNFWCYPGFLVGKVFWAIIWPLSIGPMVFVFGFENWAGGASSLQCGRPIF